MSAHHRAPESYSPTMTDFDLLIIVGFFVAVFAAFLVWTLAVDAYDAWKDKRRLAAKRRESGRTVDPQ